MKAWKTKSRRKSYQKVPSCGLKVGDVHYKYRTFLQDSPISQAAPTNLVVGYWLPQFTPPLYTYRYINVYEYILGPHSCLEGIPTPSHDVSR